MSTAVLLATYNGEKYIGELLDSLFAQTYQDFTIYVHDDGSTDRTMGIVEEYGNRYQGRITVLKGPRFGSAKESFLWLLSAVNADYYFFCDQDDVWLEGKMEREMGVIDPSVGEADSSPSRMGSLGIDPSVSGADSSPSRMGSLGIDPSVSRADSSPSPKGSRVVFSDMYVVDEGLKVLSDSFIRYIGRDISRTRYSQIVIDNPAAGCTMCINRDMRDLVVDSLPWVDLKNIPMHDAYILALASLCGEIIGIDEPLVYYRQTGNNTMGASTESEGDKVARNVADMKSGGFFAKKRAFINEARLFGGELAKVNFLPVDKRDVLLRFSQIESMSKFKRLSFYKRHKFDRAHHNFWMRLFV